MSSKQKAMDKLSEYLLQFGFVEIASGAMWEVNYFTPLEHSSSCLAFHHCICEVEPSKVPNKCEYFMEGDGHRQHSWKQGRPSDIF